VGNNNHHCLKLLGSKNVDDEETKGKYRVHLGTGVEVDTHAGEDQDLFEIVDSKITEFQPFLASNWLKNVTY
jgi:hypothetical protein